VALDLLETKTLTEFTARLYREACQRCILRDKALIYGKHEFPIPSSYHPDVHGEQVPIVFVGKGPGDAEARALRPLAGRAEEWLTSHLLQEGITPDKYLMLNSVMCHVDSGRDPLQKQIRACQPLLFHQLKFLQPKLIITLGPIPTRQLLGLNRTPKMSDWAGYEGELEIDSFRFRVLAAYHPRYLIRAMVEGVIPASLRESYDQMTELIKGELGD